MAQQRHEMAVEQVQRVDVLGDLNAETRHVWLALHGYGQLVQYFGRHFRDLVQPGRAFVLPQGPHKFYLSGVHGRVGASWMTKEDRLVDIDNQERYLNGVLDWVREACPQARVHVVAFSQGVATAMRFLGKNRVPVDSLLAWAGSWPPDLEQRSVKALADLNFRAWFGDADEFIDLEKQAHMVDHYEREFGMKLTWSRYEGGHTFKGPILAQTVNELEGL